jgi:hypothetical protein
MEFPCGVLTFLFEVFALDVEIWRGLWEGITRAIIRVYPEGRLQPFAASPMGNWGRFLEPFSGYEIKA